MSRKIIIGLYCIITGVPLGLGLSYSLLYSIGLVGLMHRGVTGRHWVSLWSDTDALSSLGYSGYLTLVSLGMILGLALLVSWWQHSPGSGRRFYHLLFLPLTFPPLIAAFAWFYLLSPGGILSRLAVHLGLTGGVEDFPRWVNDYYSVGILLTHGFLVFPLFTLLFIDQAKKERVGELLTIAFTLGSSRTQFLWRVYVPLILKKSQTLIVLYALFLLGTYEVPLLLGRSSPRVVTLFITDNMTRFNLNDIPVGHAMTVLYSLLVVGITWWVRPRKTRWA